ncbi:MAG: MarR family winged helix-turn-helix transcriptional regulator [Nocardioidaceae bacterium]
MTNADELIPLARLLAMAYRDLIENLHHRLRERGWNQVRPAFGFVLLAARDAPITITEIAALMGATKQAASKLAAAMSDAGYLVMGTDSADGRQRPLRLSPRGGELLADVEDIYRELEAEWAKVIGAPALKRLRRSLHTAVLASHGGDLPAVRPSW